MIGIFDSGVGGLSVWREIVRLLPDHPTFYVADQLHAPYGQRTNKEILGYSRAITQYLLGQGCTLVVVACNTASAVSLEVLRAEFNGVHIIGMEPAIKPAVKLSKNGVIGVLATPGTFRGTLFNETVRMHAPKARVIRQACPGLVEQIETGNHAGLETNDLVEIFLGTLQKQGADTIVLGCTHYPFVRELIQNVAGPQVTILDPAPAVALQTARLLGETVQDDVEGCEPVQVNEAHRFFTSGDADRFQAVAAKLLCQDICARSLTWRQPVGDHRLILEHDSLK